MQLQIIAFHTWKAGRTGLSMRIIMTSLAWYLRNPVDAEMVDVLTKVVPGGFRPGDPLEAPPRQLSPHRPLLIPGPCPIISGYYELMGDDWVGWA